MNIEVFPTMITPFLANGQVDYVGVEKLTEFYWKKGCDGIFAVCQSSEMFFLTQEERYKIAKTVVNKANNLAKTDDSRPRMKIVVSGHVANDFDEQVEELSLMAKTNADALILLTNKFDIENTSEQKWIADLNRLIEKLPNVPLGLYECPKPYKRLLTSTMLEEIKQLKRFKFIKDTCCDAAMIGDRVKSLSGSGIMLYNANAQTLLESTSAGASGYCGVMANFHPDIIKKVFEIAPECREILQAYVCLSAFTESLCYPANAKYYLSEFEGIEIGLSSRAVDCSGVTDYVKSVLAQMKTLGDYLLLKLI